MMKRTALFGIIVALAMTSVQCEPLAPTVPSTRLPVPTIAVPTSTPLSPATPTEDPRQRVEAAAKGLTSKDPGQATAADAQTALTLAGEAQKLGLDNGAKDLLEWLKKVLTLLAEAALKKNACEATQDNIRNALELAGEAQKLGLDDLANRLITWAKSGLQSYAAGRVAAGADAQERTALAAEAQKLGLDQLAQDLMAGKAIASGCAETWQGTLEMRDEFSTPQMELISQLRVPFNFQVDRQGKVQGTGRAKFTLVKYVVYPAGPGSGPCPGQVEQPDFDVRVSGAKMGQTFELKWEGTAKATTTVPPCGWPGGSFRLDPIKGETPFAFSATIPSQEGTHSVVPGASVEIKKTTP